MALIIKTRLCIQCGAEITKRYAKAYCSVDCRKAHASENRWTDRENTKVCPQCGKEFVTRSRTRKYCNYDCQHAARIKKLKEKRSVRTKVKKPFRKDATRAAAPKAVLPILHKLCRHCGKAFDTPNCRRLFCCASCRRAADNERKAQQRLEYRESELRPKGWWGIKTYSPWDDVAAENVAGNTLDDYWAGAPIEDVVINLPERESSKIFAAVAGKMQSDMAKTRSENLMDEEKMKHLETTAILFRNAFLKLKEAHRMEREAEAFFSDAVKSGEAAKMFNLDASEGII